MTRKIEWLHNTCTWDLQ